MERGKLQTVQMKVREVFEQGNFMSRGIPVEYCFCSWEQFNVKLKEIEGPAILQVLPPSGKLLFDMQYIKDKPECEFCFVDLTNLDFDGEENDQIVERMKRLAIAFFKALEESGMFEIPVEELDYQVPYDTADENVTGVIITLPIKEVEGICMFADSTRRQGDDIDIL